MGCKRLGGGGGGRERGRGVKSRSEINVASGINFQSHSQSEILVQHQQYAISITLRELTTHVASIK